MFSYDATGGKYEEADFQANGSGGVHARNWIKAGWSERHGRRRRRSTSRSRALFAAADEDSATGGPDLVRRIYPDGRDRSTPTATARLADDDDRAPGPRVAASNGGHEEGRRAM